MGPRSRTSEHTTSLAAPLPRAEQDRILASLREAAEVERLPKEKSRDDELVEKLAKMRARETSAEDYALAEKEVDAFVASYFRAASRDGGGKKGTSSPVGVSRTPQQEVDLFQPFRSALQNYAACSPIDSRAEVGHGPERERDERETTESTGEDHRREATATSTCSRPPPRLCVVLDMDCFFAAAELRDREAELRDRPVAIVDLGAVCTANYVARRYGVGVMRVQYARELCRLQKVALVELKCDYAKYGEASKDVQRVLRREFRIPKASIEVPSMDEMFLDLTDLVRERVGKFSLQQQSTTNKVQSCTTKKPDEWEVVSELVREIRRRVLLRTNMSCSAGIGPNFALAKMASNVNKPDGQFCCCLREDVRQALVASEKSMFHDPTAREEQLSNAALRPRLDAARKAKNLCPAEFFKTDHFLESKNTSLRPTSGSLQNFDEEEDDVASIEHPLGSAHQHRAAAFGDIEFNNSIIEATSDPDLAYDVWLPTLPARAWPGIGPVTAKLLAHYEVHTLKDVHRKRGLLWRVFGAAQAQLLALAGVGIEKVAEKKCAHKQSVGQERSFGREVRDLGVVKSRLKALSERVAEELANLKLEGRTVTLRLKKAKTFEYKAWSKGFGSGRGGKAYVYAHRWSDIYDTAVELLEGGVTGRGGTNTNLGSTTTSITKEAAWASCPHGVWLAGVTVSNCRPVTPASHTPRGQLDDENKNEEFIFAESREKLGRGNSSLCARLWQLESEEEEEGVAELGGEQEHEIGPVFRREEAIDLDEIREGGRDGGEEQGVAEPAGAHEHGKRRRVGDLVEEEIDFDGEIVAGFDCDELL